MKAKINKILIYLSLDLLKRYYGYSKISTKLLYAQAYHETGDFTSEVWKQNKNMFGMRQPQRRKTLAKGSNLNHATYKNWFDSIRDYFYRQKEFSIPNESDTRYIEKTVASGYAEDRAYKTKWEKLITSIDYPKILGIQVGFFFAMLIIFFILFRLDSHKHTRR